MIAQQHHRTVEVEAEVHFADACLGHSARNAAVVGLEEQKPTAAGADQFAASRAALRSGPRRRVRRSAYCSCHLNEIACASSARASGVRIAEYLRSLEFFDLEPELLGEMQVLDHAGVARFGFFFWSCSKSEAARV